MDTFDRFISLGGCCELTFVKSIFKLNGEHTPFDNLGSYVFDDMLMALERKFEFETEHKISKYSLTPQLHLKGTDIIIPHRTCSDEEEVAILKRRYIRMIEYLSTTNERVLFVRKNHISLQVTTEQVQKLIEWIKSINPVLNYSLLIIDEYPTNVKPNEITIPGVIYQTIVSDTYIKLDKNDFFKIIIDCNLPNHHPSLDWWKGFITTELKTQPQTDQTQ